MELKHRLTNSMLAEWQSRGFQIVEFAHIGYEWKQPDSSYKISEQLLDYAKEWNKQVLKILTLVTLRFRISNDYTAHVLMTLILPTDTFKISYVRSLRYERAEEMWREIHTYSRYRYHTK